MIKAGIIGIGSYVPEKVITNYDLEQVVDTTDEWIASRTGIRERRVLADNQATSDLAILAAEKALADAKLTPDQVELIIVATISPDKLFPATSCIVQDALGAKNAAAFDLSAGCSGFVYGLVTASQFVEAGLYEKVLVIGADALSRLVDWEDRRTCVLFGDAASAVVVGKVPEGYGLLASVLGADGSGEASLQVPAGGTRLPASIETVRDNQHFIKMEGREVFKFAVRVMQDATLQVLEKANLSLTDIDLFIPHQANVRIIEASLNRLGVRDDQVFINVDRYGNTSAASIGLALDEALSRGLVSNGTTLALVGFGAGLTWGGAVLRWYNPKEGNNG